MLATAVLVAQYAGTFEVLDTTRVQGRASQPAPTVSIGPPAANTGLQAQGKDVVSVDVSTIPMARLQLKDRSWDSTLSYSPSFTAGELELGLNVQVFHVGLASVGWHDRAWRLLFSEAGSYGQFNTAFQQPTTTQGQSMSLQPVAGFTTIDAASSITSGTAALRATPRATLVLAGVYTVSGGVTSLAQQVLPKQYGPGGFASLAYLLSRRDTAVTLASVHNSTTSGACPGQALQQPATFCEETATTSELQETFRHQLSPVANLSLSAGVAASVVEAPSFGQELVIEPTALIAFTYRFGSPMTNLGSTLATSTPGATSASATSANGDSARAAAGDGEGRRADATIDATGTQSGPAAPGSSPGTSPDASATPGPDARGSGAVDAAAGSTPGLPTGRMNELALTAQLSPIVDPRTGLVSERVQALASLSRRVTSATTLRLTASFLQSVPVPKDDPYPITSVNASVEVRTLVDRQLEVGVGALELWQDQSVYGTLTSTVVYMTVTARAPTVKF